MSWEIKFRAWDGKRMHEVPPLQELCDNDLYAYGFGKSLVFMQFTGLKDKNGVEIYEGDYTHAKGSKTVFRVEYVDGSFCLIPHHTHSKESKELWEADNGKLNIMPLHLMMKKGGLGDLEVIGNIYQNPYLLQPNDLQEAA